jgi:hypothetical protein
MWTFTVLLFVLWGLGLATDYTGSGLIHILPMLGIAVVLVRFIEGRPMRSMGHASSESNDRVVQMQEKV